MVAVAIGRERVNHARMPRAGEKGPTLHTTTTLQLPSVLSPRNKF